MKVVLLVKTSCGLRGMHFTGFSGTTAALRMGVLCCLEMLVTTYRHVGNNLQNYTIS